MKDKIKIKGASEHNLKNIDVDIPRNKLVVFTGVSGSGKSSLAFDTIYAEGQRRYVESLSSYARQFLGVMGKPKVDSIEGLSPAIAIDQKSSSSNPRSTVGTITEIYDYLRLLYARIGHPHCPNCGDEITAQFPAQISKSVIGKISQKVKASKSPQSRFLILSPVVRGRKGEFKNMFIDLKKKGFTHVRVDGRFFALDDDLYIIKTNRHTIEVVCDRISVGKKLLKNKERIKQLGQRVNESVETSLSLSDGLVVLSQVSDASFDFPEKPQKTKDYLYSQLYACPKCNISLPEMEPRMFSFNSPHGACKECTGIGTLLKADRDQVLNMNLSITEGGILPFARLILSDTWYGKVILEVARHIGIDKKKPLKYASKEKIDKLLYGTGDYVHEVRGKNRYGRETTIYETFNGLIVELEKRYIETKSEAVRRELGKYMKEEICFNCKGTRLKKEALAVIINKTNIAQLCSKSIKNAFRFIKDVKKTLSKKELEIASMILKEVYERLDFLQAVGLSYLTLDRNASTLAGGEAQRIRLASQIGSGLSGVLYVLDEPSIGLHPRDNGKLIKTLKKLRDLGNTVIVVEHDRDMIESADLLVDFGPGGGKHGGKITAQDTPEKVKKIKDNLTGKYLSGRKKIKIVNHNPQKQNGKKLVAVGCKQHNLKNINTSFPLDKLICVTGVSGSGKSTLVVDTLYKAMKKYFNPYYREKAGEHEKIEGKDFVSKVILVDQSPIGRTPRSNPATYIGAFTYIRKLFAKTIDARNRGYSKSRFSFNISGGRCESCRGEGVTKIEMQFLPDVYIVCEVCRGLRYNAGTLEVKYKGKNIAQVLKMTVEEAKRFFQNIPGLSKRLEILDQVGLSYLELGQPATQLSGGEAQRVKIAKELSKKTTKHTLYILDEPTTGLHFADLEKLLRVLRLLADKGNTVLVIEHNLDVVKNADWVIDLGPEGGDYGGEIVAQGSPWEIARDKSSYTGKHLKKVLN